MGKLEDLRDEVKRLNEGRKQHIAVLDAAVDSAQKADDGTLVFTTEKAAEAQKAAAEARQLREQISMLEGMIREIEFGKQAAEPSVAVQVAAELAKGGFRVYGEGSNSAALSKAFVDSEQFKELIQSGGGNMRSPFEVEKEVWRAWRSKDIFSDLPTGTPGAFGTVARDPLVPMSRRSVRVRDLFPARPTTAAVIEYFRVTSRDNNASTVGERSGGAFAAKPQSGLEFQGFQAPVRTIAHWEAAHRNVLADEPQLRGLIDGELLYGLQLEEDNQILNGSGTGNDLEGLHVVSGTQSYSWSSGEVGDNKADAIRRSATLAYLSNYEPTGVVVHPTDWEHMELAKDDNGQYLLAVAIAVGAEKRIWRMPVVDTPAQNSGRALVGAFGLGAQLYDREQGSVRIAEQHEDFFIRNAIVVLAEERLALAVKRPDAFVEVDFDSAPV